MNSLFNGAEYFLHKDNDIKKLIETVSDKTGIKMANCHHDFFLALQYVMNNEPSCYWNNNVLVSLFTELDALGNSTEITEEMYEYFLMGRDAYEQVTRTINDYADISEDSTMKNRQYRMPVYNSIVEGCLTNFFHFIVLILDQNTAKNYSNATMLNKFIEILSSNGFDFVTDTVDKNIRNAINHGGILFKDNGKKIVFYYMDNHQRKYMELTQYEFDDLINKVYDVASSVYLSILLYMNKYYEKITVDLSQKTFASFALLGMQLSSINAKCLFISESPNGQQLNADYYVSNTDKESLIQLGITIAINIYRQFSDYEKYFVGFQGERLMTSWIIFDNQHLSDFIHGKRTLEMIFADVMKKQQMVLFNSHDTDVDLREIKFFRFPLYKSERLKINRIEDASTPERKRLRAHFYVGELNTKQEILSAINEGIDWMRTLKNVDSAVNYRKNGEMEPDALYINVYHTDGRNGKNLLTSNENFICFVDYNSDGPTQLVNGGLPPIIWNALFHEKFGNTDIAWREKKYLQRLVKKIGVNEPCPCGSGKKFKKCCKGKKIYD